MRLVIDTAELNGEDAGPVLETRLALAVADTFRERGQLIVDQSKHDEELDVGRRMVAVADEIQVCLEEFYATGWVLVQDIVQRVEAREGQ